MACEPANIGSGCSLACARCWAASGALLEAPACAQRCASGDQAYISALILLAPCLGRLLVEGLVLPRVRSPGAKRKKKARRSGRKKSPRRQQYEDVDGGAAGVTFGQLLADGDDSIYAAKDGGDIQLRPAGSWRWIISLLALVMWLVCYADRTNISLAIIEMEEEYGWDHAVDGVVLSSFFWG